MGFETSDFHPLTPDSKRIQFLAMTCDLCNDDDGKGAHYHAFIDGKHYWICGPCKERLKIESEHTDE